MRNLLTKLHKILNELKGFNACVSSDVSDTMTIEYEGKYYAVKVTEVEPVDVTDEMRKSYSDCEDNLIILAELMKYLKDY